MAKGLSTSRKHLSLILNAHTGISAEMALKPTVAFGTIPEFWINFQRNYYLWQARPKVGVSKLITSWTKRLK